MSNPDFISFDKAVTLEKPVQLISDGSGFWDVPKGKVVTVTQVKVSGYVFPGETTTDAFAIVLVHNEGWDELGGMPYTDKAIEAGAIDVYKNSGLPVELVSGYMQFSEQGRQERNSMNFDSGSEQELPLEFFKEHGFTFGE